MNILILNYEYPPLGGGAATASRNVAEKMAEKGHEIHVISSGFRGLPARSTEQGVHVRRVKCLRRSMNECSLTEMFSFACSASSILPYYLKSNHIEIVLVVFAFPTGPIGLFGHWLTQVPYTITLCGGDVVGAEPGLDRLHFLLGPIRRCIFKKSAAVIAPSIGLKDMAQKADPVPIKVIPNGVDTRLFHPSAQPPSDPFVFLFAGRFHPQKNLLNLLAAVHRLTAMTRVRFVLRLLGGGPQEDDLRTRCQDLGIADKVEFSPWVERAQMPDIYRSCHCLVNPSSYEGLPLMVLEAMACGLPVVATNVPGNDTLVKHGETGFLVNPTVPEELAEAMKKILINHDQAGKMGMTARQSIVRDYTWDSITKAYLELFHKVIYISTKGSMT